MIDEKQARSGNSFIDENHTALLNTINSISQVSERDWNRGTFLYDVAGFIKDLENHHHHEETILKAAGYINLGTHSSKHREISMRTRDSSMGVDDFNSSMIFMDELRSMIFSHELLDDQDYWSLFDNQAEYNIKWSTSYETGNETIDKHHQCLLNYINRLDLRFSECHRNIEECQSLAIGELKLFYEYSKLHFKEEESTGSFHTVPGHQAQHDSLLIDLARLILEIERGKFLPANLGDYLSYWLINHIQLFDIPSFANKK